MRISICIKPGRCRDGVKVAVLIKGKKAFKRRMKERSVIITKVVNNPRFLIRDFRSGIYMKTLFNRK